MGRFEPTLAYIRAYIAEHGHGPSVREIQVGAGLSSTSMVDYHLKALKQAGRIKILDGPCPACGGIRRQRLEIEEER